MDLIIGRSARLAGLVLRNTTFHVPKLTLVPTRCLCQCDTKRLNVKIYETNIRWRANASYDRLRYDLLVSGKNLSHGFLYSAANPYATEASKQPDKAPSEPPPPEKQSIFQKMKQMTKDYWYILIPVHVVTSIGWMTMFYTAAKNGVDIVSILESLNLSERYLDILRGSSAGHWAVAYALYKLFTPIRYTVTVGGTTMSIRYLNKFGYLKFKPRSTIKEAQSTECAAKHGERITKEAFKGQHQAEPPKT